MSYNIVFYEKKNGESEIREFLENLRKKAANNKDARIQYKQVVHYIELLEQNGTDLPQTITKHLEDDIWELRPGINRIFYFYSSPNDFVLLHSFRKKTRKTPRRELEKAKSERDDFLSRKGR